MGQQYELRLIGDYQFDEVTSSLQKMIRRGREYEACYWSYILHQSGYGQYIWRRLSIITCEDIGNGTPLAPVIISSLQQSWLLLHKHNKEPDLDKFLLVVQAVLFLSRSKKSRENDSISNLIEEHFKAGDLLKIDEVSLDSHTERGRKTYGAFSNKTDGKGKLRLQKWFSEWSYIENKASYKDKWVDELKAIWHEQADQDVKIKKKMKMNFATHGVTTLETELISHEEINIHSILDNLDISENTRKEYEYRIKIFLTFVKSEGFNLNTYLEFKRFLHKKNGLSISSKNKYLVVARIYCRQLHRQGVIPDITAGIKSFNQTRKHKKEGLTQAEIERVIYHISQLPETTHNARLKAILCLLTLQGLRQIEIIRLNVKDIDFVSQRAFIQGKGKDDLEPIDLHPETAKSLRIYLRINKIADGALFISNSNNSRDQRLTTKSIRNLINPLLKELSIDKTVHGFRHFFATKLIQSYKGDLLEVARYTRHRSLEMLQIYNDSIKRKADLPRYYATFDNIGFNQR